MKAVCVCWGYIIWLDDLIAGGRVVAIVRRVVVVGRRPKCRRMLKMLMVVVMMMRLKIVVIVVVAIDLHLARLVDRMLLLLLLLRVQPYSVLHQLSNIHHRLHGHILLLLLIMLLPTTNTIDWAITFYELSCRWWWYILKANLMIDCGGVRLQLLLLLAITVQCGRCRSAHGRRRVLALVLERSIAQR